jgi:hypothetical protein
MGKLMVIRGPPLEETLDIFLHHSMLSYELLFDVIPSLPKI